MSILALVFIVLPVEAATLEWAALPGKERIHIKKEAQEGMAGNVARIDSKGILIPFTQVPLGLVISSPEESAIFDGTEKLGRAIAIKTKTPEFGFVVVKETPTTLIIDFFHDKLGARWKPTKVPPTTDVAPTYAVDDYPESQTKVSEVQAPAVGWTERDELNLPESADVKGIDKVRGVPTTSDNKDKKEELSPGHKVQAEALMQSSLDREEKASRIPVLTPGNTSEPVNYGGLDPLFDKPEEDVKEGQDSSLVDTRIQTSQRESVLPEPGLSQDLPKNSPLSDQELKALASLSQDKKSPEKILGSATQDKSNQGVGESAETSLKEKTKQSMGLLPGIGQKTGTASYRGRFNPGGLEDISEAQPEPVVHGARGKAVTEPDKDSGTLTLAPAGEAPQERIEAQLEAQTRNDLEDTSEVIQEEASPAVVAEAKTESSGDDDLVEEKEQVMLDADLTPPLTSDQEEEVIYVDEHGEVIEPPADPKARLEEIRQDASQHKFADALEKTETLLLQTNLSKEQREEALHIQAEMVFNLNKDDLELNAQKIIDTTNQAINANMRSPRNAAALLRLGYLHLKTENIPEARGRFNLLRRMYPEDENVPLSYYYWGDYYYNKGDLQRAVNEFQLVLQKYPDSKYARESALGLSRAFYRLGYYEQAYSIVEYIEQRWPQFYLSYPPFLNMMGDVAFRLGDLDNAVRHYWLYVNLDPEGNEADLILTRIGDIYAMQQQMDAAKELYSEAVQRFPSRDGGLISLMRLAEESINDDPNISTMFDSFEKKPILEPREVYEKIIMEHPDNGLVPLSYLKLSMWYLWKHDYVQSLDLASEFMQKFPNDALAPKVKELALKTFAILAAESVADGSYGRMRNIWENYPLLQGQEEMLTPESRVALGVSYWKDGRPDDALVAVEPFFLGNKIPQYSEMALNLILNIYSDYEQWPAIEEVARRVQLWEISKENKLQLDYALALAKENQGKSDEAALLWEKLYDSKELSDDQMVFATYFLARDAERLGKNDEAYLLGSEALNRLKEEADRNPDHADRGKIKSQLSALMSLTEEGGRLGESLQYADEYLGYLPEEDPDRASVYFRMARIYRKQGNENKWRQEMEKIANDFPDTVYGQTAASALSSNELEREASRFSPGSM